ncbi:MAG: hypothetical protein ABFS45_19895 [Pseudomonadota bacterium]
MLEWMIHHIAWVAAAGVVVLIGIKLVVYRIVKRLMSKTDSAGQS